jgi:hypothetical protein
LLLEIHRANAGPRDFGIGILLSSSRAMGLMRFAGNLIVRERCPSAAVGVAGRRIVNDRRGRAEVAVPERRLRNMRLREAAAVVAVRT